MIYFFTINRISKCTCVYAIQVYCGVLNYCSCCDMMLVWFGLLACWAKVTMQSTQFKFSFSFFNIIFLFLRTWWNILLYFFLGVGFVGYTFIYSFAILWVGPNNCMLALDNGWEGPLPDFIDWWFLRVCTIKQKGLFGGVLFFFFFFVWDFEWSKISVKILNFMTNLIGRSS